MPIVKAVTFDLWDTLIVDDSDEPVRAQLGLLSKREARRQLVTQALNARKTIDPGVVRVAYDTVDAAFNQVWHHQHVTWSVRERLAVLLQGLSRTLPADQFDDLVRLHEDMEWEVKPCFGDGAAAMVRQLAGEYRLAVISDAIFSPGRVLRQLLVDAGIDDCFSAFVFSDEVGCSKPAARVFELAAQKLGMAPTDMVHIGDREHNDINGAHSAGCRAVLFTAIKDRRADTPTKAEAVCSSFARLPSVISKMSAT